MPDGSDDPAVLRSIAVTTGDVVAALEARRRTGRRAVLRVTPPFSARMRARLHVEGREGEYGASPAPIHLHPERLVGDVPRYPEPSGTGEPPRPGATDGGERAESVEAWRAAVRESVVEAVTLPGTDHRVEVKALGRGQ
ncbi:MAG: hypothetical protein ABEH47_09330 [Haloferacaceae archaeon]